ncbi:MAG: hypothetical protein RL885_30745 [Planctomycetota bacterium]
MSCPSPDAWARYAMGGSHDDGLREHLEHCDACRERFEQERRLEAALTDHYEMWSRDVDAPGNTARLMQAITHDCPGRSHRRWVRWAAAALVLILVTSYWLPFRSALALADVLAELEAATSMQCRVHSTSRGLEVGKARPRSFTRVWMSAGHGGRSDVVVEGQLVETTLLDVNGWATIIDHAAKRAYRQVDPGDGQKNFFDAELEPAVYLAILRDLLERFERRSGREVIEGRLSEGFEVDGSTRREVLESYLPESFRRQALAMKRMRGDSAAAAARTPAAETEFVRIWVDVEKRLPVRIEEHGVDARGDPSIQIRDELVWNEPIPDERFEVPGGYAIELETVEPLPRGTPEDLVEALRLYAALRGGGLPEHLAGISRQLREALQEAHGWTLQDIFQADLESIPDSEARDRLARHREHAEKAFFFLVDVFGGEEEAVYSGADVTWGEPEVVLKWRAADGVRWTMLGDGTVIRKEK